MWIEGTEKVRSGVMRKAKTVSEKRTSDQAWRKMAGDAIQKVEEKHEKMQ